MRAVYEVCECPGTLPCDIVGRVTISIPGDCADPDTLERRIEAIKVSGNDPYAQCDNGCGPAYQARFVECVDLSDEGDCSVSDSLYDNTEG